MKKIEWNERFSVKVKEIDDQHRKLIRIINRLVSLEDETPSFEAAAGVIDEMRQYLSYHFETEENLMRKYAYPEYESHKRQHDHFKQETADFCDRIARNDRKLPRELLEFLTTWLVGHIIGSDAKYAPFFKSDA